jgi:PAS domain-containing protein
MFAHQLVTETRESISAGPQAASLNDAESARRLLEQHTGFCQFRVVLPGTVTWAGDAAALPGVVDLTMARTLEQTVLSFVAEDRPRVLDAIEAAIRERQGFRFTARIRTSRGLKVVEVIGDVVLTESQVTGIMGMARDVSGCVEREALAISRARLIRHLVEDMPVPIVVLDRGLTVVACSADWARTYGLSSRAAALNRPLGRIAEVNREMTGAIIEALGGRTVHIGLWFYSGDDGRQVRRSCAVIPWHCGADAAGGVMMVVGGGEPNYASLEIADRALGRTTKGLLELLETLQAA